MSSTGKHRLLPIKPTGRGPWAWRGALVLLLLSNAPARACNVPLFRYALERWPADAYEVLLFHKGPLTPDDQALADELGKYVDGRDCHANFTFERIDLDKNTDAEARRLLEAQPAPELPWLVVRYPPSARRREKIDVAWAGRLRGADLKALLDSPARRQIVRRILRGESAAWVLLESGDPKRDGAAAALLEAQSRVMEREIKLPTGIDSKDPLTVAATAASAGLAGLSGVLRAGSPDDGLLTQNGPALRVAFSVVRVARADPAERLLVKMLLGLEDDLAGRQEAMVFPVFGRGRVLYALVGKGITAENVQEAGEFLVGACKCKVKRDAPGVDLLINADWEGLLDGRVVRDPPLPPLIGLADFVPPALPPDQAGPEARVEALSAGGPAEGSEPMSPLVRNGLLAVLLGLAGLAVAAFILLGLRRNHG